MSNELTGKIKVINDTQTFDSGFQKREFVVTTNETYPQDIKLELIKDKCGILDTYKVGQDVKVSFNLRGSYYEPKDAYYVNLQAWRIELNSEDGVDHIAHEAKVNAQPKKEFDETDESDSLPF
jgi:hypothetical protein